MEKEGTLPKSFCEATAFPIPKPDKDITKEESTNQYFHDYRCKNLQQNSSKQNPATII